MRGVSEFTILFPAVAKEGCSEVNNVLKGRFNRE